MLGLSAGFLIVTIWRAMREINKAKREIERNRK